MKALLTERGFIRGEERPFENSLELRLGGNYVPFCDPKISSPSSFLFLFLLPLLPSSKEWGEGEKKGSGGSSGGGKEVWMMMALVVLRKPPGWWLHMALRVSCFKLPPSHTTTT